MTAELAALTSELQATRAMLATVIDRLDAADRRANRHRLWTAVLAVTVVLVLVLGGLFWQDQTQQSVAACERGNETRENIREAIVGTIDRLAEGAPAERREALLTDAEAYLLETLPPRSC